jgi:hypothetical protein
MLPIIVRFAKLALILFFVLQASLVCVLLGARLLGRDFSVPWIIRLKVGGMLSILCLLPYLARAERNFRRRR